MRIVAVLIAGAALAVAPAGAALAKSNAQWEHNGKRYSSYEACKAAKKKSRDRAAVVGAASSGTVAAIAGGSFGETALVAGAGALAGSVIGKNAKKC